MVLGLQKASSQPGDILSQARSIYSRAIVLKQSKAEQEAATKLAQEAAEAVYQAQQDARGEQEFRARWYRL